MLSCKIEGYIATTAWLIKHLNEDRIWYILNENMFRACLCDGHWWTEAAEITYETLLSDDIHFPKNKEESILLLKWIEQIIYWKHGDPLLTWEDWEKTPESSIISFEISHKILRLITYGDCRFFILRGDYTFQTPMIQSWIWSFSYLKLRNRLTVENWAFYWEFNISPWDIILMFSDGIDECVYEKPTIPISKICETARQTLSIEEKINILLNEVYENGAEDNASIGIFRII